MNFKFLISIIFILSSATVSGCSNLSRSEKTMLRELESYGISPEEHKTKEPALAGALNILPGFGNFYLATNSDESDQWLFGFLNLLTWPISVVWGIPEAAIDANNINKKETIYYYRFDETGKAELEELKSKMSR